MGFFAPKLHAHLRAGGAWAGKLQSKCFIKTTDCPERPNIPTTRCSVTAICYFQSLPSEFGTPLQEIHSGNTSGNRLLAQALPKLSPFSGLEQNPPAAAFFFF